MPPETLNLGPLDPLPRRHELLPWHGRAPLQLEVAGDEGDEELVNLRIAGRIITDLVRDDLWQEAEALLADRNERFHDSAEDQRSEHHGDRRREACAGQ